MGGSGVGVRLPKLERADLRVGDLAGGRGWNGVLRSRRAARVRGLEGGAGGLADGDGEGGCRQDRGRGWRGQGSASWRLRMGRGGANSLLEGELPPVTLPEKLDDPRYSGDQWYLRVWIPDGLELQTPLILHTLVDALSAAH